jgi:hypothetical protein
MVFTLSEDTSKILVPGTHLSWDSDDQESVEEQFLLYTTEAQSPPVFNRMPLALTDTTATLSDLITGEPYLIQVVQMLVDDVKYSNTLKVTPSRRPDAPVISSVVGLDNSLSVSVAFSDSENASPLNQIVFSFSDGTNIFSVKRDLRSTITKNQTLNFTLTSVDNTLLVNYAIFEMAAYTTNDRGTSVFSLAKVAECSDFPNQPTALLLVASSSTNDVTSTWTHPSDYEAYRSSSSVLRANIVYKLKANSWDNGARIRSVLIDLKSVAVNSHVIPNSILTLGAVYVMKIRYQNDYGYGTYSDEIDFTPFDIANAPNFLPLTGKRTTAEMATLLFEWTPPTFLGGFSIKHYLLRYKNSDGTPHVNMAQHTLHPASSGYNHLFQETPVDSSLLLELSAVTISNEDAQALANDSSFTGYTTYEGASASITRRHYSQANQVQTLTKIERNREVQLDWLPPLFTGFQATDDYTVKYEISSEKGTSVQSTNSIILQNLTNGTSLTVSVKAIVTYAETGEDIYGDHSTIVINPFQPPSVPQNVQLTPSDGLLTLLWDAPERDGGRPIIEYLLTLRPDSEDEQTFTSFSTLSTGNYYEFNVGIVNGVSYTAKVRAISDNEGVSVVGPQTGLHSAVPFNSPIINPDVTIDENNVLKFKVQPNGRNIQRICVLATDEDGHSATETLFVDQDVSQDYTGIVTGTIEIPVHFDDFSSAISKYLILVFTDNGTSILNTFQEESSPS